MDIFLQVLQEFYNRAIFKPFSGTHFPMSELEHMLSFTTSSFDKLMYKKVIYKKQAPMFFQNHSLTLYKVEIFCNSILREIIVIGLENGLEKSRTA